MADPEGEMLYCENHPGLLGHTYIGFHGSSGLVIGSTKQYDWDPRRSLEEPGRGEIPREECSDEVAFLEEEAKRLWKPSKTWDVTSIKSGVRALTSMTNDGAMPYAGQVGGATRHPCSRHL